MHLGNVAPKSPTSSWIFKVDQWMSHLLRWGVNFIPLTGTSMAWPLLILVLLQFYISSRSTQGSLEIFSDKTKVLGRERKEVLTLCLPSSSTASDQYKKGFSSSQESLSFPGGLVNWCPLQITQGGSSRDEKICGNSQWTPDKWGYSKINIKHQNGFFLIPGD